MKRLDELAERLPQLDMRSFGPGYHFLLEERPERVIEMVSACVAEHSGVRLLVAACSSSGA